MQPGEIDFEKLVAMNNAAIGFIPNAVACETARETKVDSTCAQDRETSQQLPGGLRDMRNPAWGRATELGPSLPASENSSHATAPAF